MRIVHHYGHENPNGITNATMDVSRRMCERGHAVHIVCRTDSPMKTYPDSSTYLYLAGLHLPFLRAHMRRVFTRQRTEVFNAHSQRDAAVVMQVAKAMGVPTCYTCHELSERACDDAPLADHVIAVSAGVGHFLRERYQIAPERLHIVPNGIDLALLPQEPRAALREAFSFGADEVWVGFAGRIVPNKNVGGLIRGFAAAVKQHPALRLAVMGTGRREAACRKLAAELGVEVFIRFTGWLPRDTALRAIGGLDALVVPSLGAEGLSNVMLAAMAHGVPVLATDIPSLADGPLRDGETGWLCPTDDAGLAAGLARVAETRYRQVMGEAARAEIADGYRVEHMVEKLLGAYQAAVGGVRGDGFRVSRGT